MNNLKALVLLRLWCDAAVAWIYGKSIWPGSWRPNSDHLALAQLSFSFSLFFVCFHLPLCRVADDGSALSCFFFFFFCCCFCCCCYIVFLPGTDCFDLLRSIFTGHRFSVVEHGSSLSLSHHHHHYYQHQQKSSQWPHSRPLLCG